MDQDGSVSGEFGTTAEGSMAEAAQQAVEEQGEAMHADSMLQDGDTEDVIADRLPGDAAEAMLGEDGAAEDVEANGMSVEAGAESGTLGNTEAAPADGHLPQMAVLASLDQVTLPVMTFVICLQHAHADQDSM